MTAFTLSNWLPSLDWIKKYHSDQFRGDLFAGLTVGVMLVPQGMAYSMIAGLPPVYGLYASTIPVLTYALLGTSRQLAVGPVAMVSLLTVAGVTPLAGGDPVSFLSLTLLLSLMVGLIQWMLGFFRLGFMVQFLSHPVISGFTSGAAIVIGLSQLKHLLGINLKNTMLINELIHDLWQKVTDISGITLLVGVLAMGVILAGKKVASAFPGALIAVALGTIAVFALKLEQMGVSILGTVPGGLPSFQLPEISMPSIKALLPTALAISLIGFMESFAVARAIQAKTRNYRVEANRELKALGLANLAGSFFQSFPVAGGFSRTAVNFQAGAKTPLASVISAGVIILTLLFFTPLFYYLPNAVLAAVILVAVAGLFDFHEMKHLWKVNRPDFFMLAVTFVGTLFLGVDKGILIGVVLSLAMVIYKTSRPHYARLGRVPGTDVYRNTGRFSNLEEKPNFLLIRFDAQFYFANIEYIKDVIDQQAAEKGSALKYIILDAESIHNVDSSAIRMLEDLVDEYLRKEIRIIFTDVKGPVRDAFANSKLIEKLGSEGFFINNQQAIDFIESEGKIQGIAGKELTMQVNR